MFSLKELIFNLIIIHQLINECSCEPIEKITKCLTPPNTLKRVEKVIKECQEDVRTNIFKEAFNLINGHLKNAHAEHEYSSTIDHNNDHHHHHIDDGDDGTIYVVADHDNEQQHNSDISHHQYHHQNEEVEEYNFDPHENHHHNKHEHFITKLFNYHKNDNKNEPENNFHNSRYTTVEYPAANTNRYSNPFTNYNNDRIRKSIIQNKDDADYTHPTTVSYHDKRIAGCLMHCIYAKNHAIDKLGWPTLDGLVNLYSEGVHEHGYFMATLRATDNCLKGASLKHNVNRHLLPEKGESCDLAFDIFDCISDRITEYCSEHHYYNHNQRQHHHQHHHHN